MTLRAPAPRKSVPVTRAELDALDLILASPQSAGLDASVHTESAVLAHALREGLRLLREAQEGALYAAEAAARATDEEAKQRRERRARDAARQEGRYE